jgi:hypothetical protein
MFFCLRICRAHAGSEYVIWQSGHTTQKDFFCQALALFLNKNPSAPMKNNAGRDQSSGPVLGVVFDCCAGKIF